VKKEDADESLKRRVDTIEAVVLPTKKNIYKILTNILYYDFAIKNSTSPLWNLLGGILKDNLNDIVTEIHKNYIFNFEKLCLWKRRANIVNPKEKQIKLLDKINECISKFSTLKQQDEFFNDSSIYELTGLLHYDFYLRIDKILQAIKNVIAIIYEECKKKIAGNSQEKQEETSIRVAITQEEFNRKFMELPSNDEQGKEFFNYNGTFKFAEMKELFLKILLQSLAKTAEI
jgi:hypothetical protein